MFRKVEWWCSIFTDRVATLYYVRSRIVIDPKLHNRINDCFKELYNSFIEIRDMLQAKGYDVSTLDRLLSEYSSLLSRLVYVKKGEYVYASQINIFVDLSKKMLEIDKEIANLLGLPT